MRVQEKQVLRESFVQDSCNHLPLVFCQTWYVLDWMKHVFFFFFFFFQLSFELLSSAPTVPFYEYDMTVEVGDVSVYPPPPHPYFCFESLAVSLVCSSNSQWSWCTSLTEAPHGRCEQGRVSRLTVVYCCKDSNNAAIAGERFSQPPAKKSFICFWVQISGDRTGSLCH